MMKRYISNDMINNSRYAKCYSTLSTITQHAVSMQLTTLIEQNSTYCDKGNYKHLCNILTTIALDIALQQNGATPAEAFTFISSNMWAALTPTRKVMQRLAKLPFFMTLMKKVVPFGFRHGSGKGWRYTWFADTSKNEFRFECNECLYKTIFSRYGLLDRFGPMFCHSDIINYGDLPDTDFQRTRTLCQGGDKCDFCFIRHSKDEQWQRFSSI